MLTEKDVAQIREKGIEKEKIEEQINNFKKGFPFMKIIRPAIVGEGVLRVDEEQIKKYTEIFEQEKNERDIIKFVPASGAATRMFKTLFEFINKDENKTIKSVQELKEGNFDEIAQFISDIEKFAFYTDLDKCLHSKGTSIDESLEKGDYFTIIETLLNEDGLDYGASPKGLLQFHKYEASSHTPIEEHLIEGAIYANVNGIVKVHFTVSPEHKERFIELIESVRNEYEKRFNVKYDISFSVQKPSTDTIAVTPENEPFRNDDGTLLFRPGGHGALIENLNDLPSGIVFIKNIDNVAPESLAEVTFKYKKVLAGVLLHYQEKIFDYLRQLYSETGPSVSLMEEIGEFLQKKLCVLPSSNIAPKSKQERIEYLKEKLNRPLRVCGMVKNEGEPGGGPFWVETPDGTVGLQIVEGSQIDPDCEKSKKIVADATHFNPVDLVCAVKGFGLFKFNLSKFIDHNSGFISKKSKDGRDLKALELPGLWNGAMSDWNTIFVEVPIETFNPVKTVNDLLRPQHQG